MRNSVRRLQVHDFRQDIVHFRRLFLRLLRRAHEDIPEQLYFVGAAVFHHLHLPDRRYALSHQLQDSVGKALDARLHPEEARACRI